MLCDMIKPVLDTDVIIAAMRSPSRSPSGASAALLSLVMDRQTMMLASVPLFLSMKQSARIPNIGQPPDLTVKKPLYL